MAHIRPFAGVHYAKPRGADISSLVSPPFDVLDGPLKSAMLARDAHNIVAIDLPHLPAKTVGPDSAYAFAGATMTQWLKDGTLTQINRPALYPYCQSFRSGNRTLHRRGFMCIVELSPFGKGQVVPHEQTYPEAITDRLKLSRATGFQLSPVFGLFNDPRGQTTASLYQDLGRPELTAMLGDVKHDLWTVTDGSVINNVTTAMLQTPIYIADGHHRYTMALAYQAEQIVANGGHDLPIQHPANFCLFALVAMQDDGLQILPTHRLIGGLQHFDMIPLRTMLEPQFSIQVLQIPPARLPEYIDGDLPKRPAHTIGLYDGARQTVYELHPKNPDLLRDLEPTRSPAWRQLDVAVVQRYLIEQVITPRFTDGTPPKKTYVSDASQIAGLCDGATNQLALLLQPTPLHALADLGATNEVMPPKSTFFAPKMATGMVLHRLK